MVDMHTDEHDKYIRALRALDANGKVSDVHKIANTSVEVDFMHTVQKEVSKMVIGSIPYKDNQYETIFSKGE